MRAPRCIPHLVWLSVFLSRAVMTGPVRAAEDWSEDMSGQFVKHEGHGLTTQAAVVAVYYENRPRCRYAQE